MVAHIKDVKDRGGFPQAAFINSTCWSTGEVKTLLAISIIDLLCVHSDKSGQETTLERLRLLMAFLFFQNRNMCLIHAAEVQSTHLETRQRPDGGEEGVHSGWGGSL